jgi:choline kinase
MKAFWTWLKGFPSWLRSKNITTHTVGAAIVGFAIVYNSSPDVRNYIGTLLVGYPVVVTKIGVLAADIVAGVTLWRNYAHSSTAAGIVARSNAIMAGNNPPTKIQVLAATPPAK